jgi:hypothetical protein
VCSARGSVRQCNWLVVCSVCGSVRQCMCGSVPVCGSAAVGGSAAMCSSVRGSVRQSVAVFGSK